MRNFLFVAFACVLFVGCSMAKSTPLPSDLTSPELTKIASQLNEEDKKLLAGFVFRSEMLKVLPGDGSKTLITKEIKTVGDAIAAQKEWVESRTDAELQAAKLAEEQKAKREAAVEVLKQTILVGLVSNEYRPSDAMNGVYEDTQSFTLAIENKADKEIIGLKGDAVWTDTFGEEYVRIGTSIETKIGAKQKKNWTGSKEINQFMDEDKKVMSLGANHKFRFEPYLVVFSDGTKVGDSLE